MLHVPMLIKLPGNKRAGDTNTDYGRQIDLAPTILNVAAETRRPSVVR